MGWMWVWLALIVAGSAILGYLGYVSEPGRPGASATTSSSIRVGGAADPR